MSSRFTPKNLRGLRVGRLVVMRYTKFRSRKGDVMWSCKCDCGNYKLIQADYLVRGSTKSCGCLRHRPHVEEENKDHPLHDTVLDSLHNTPGSSSS